MTLETPVWAFQLEKRHQSLRLAPGGHATPESFTHSATGVLVRPGAWEDGPTLVWGRAQIERRMMQRHPDEWTPLTQNAVFEPRRGDGVSVFLADATDAPAMRTAQLLCARHAAAGASALLFTTGGRMKAAPAAAPNVVRLGRNRRQWVHCEFQLSTGDGPGWLLRAVEHFAGGVGLVQLDPEDVRPVFAAGNTGWAVEASAKGLGRARAAGLAALEQLRRLGVDPARCGGCLLMASSGPDLRLAELTEITSLFREFVSPAAHCDLRLDHRYSNDRAPFLHLSAMLVARLTP